MYSTEASLLIYNPATISDCVVVVPLGFVQSKPSLIEIMQFKNYGIHCSSCYGTISYNKFAKRCTVNVYTDQ